MAPRAGGFVSRIASELTIDTQRRHREGSTRLDAPFSIGYYCRLSTYRPPLGRGLYFLVHTAHAAHAGVAGGHRGFGFFDVAEDALGGEEHTGDAGGVL